MQKKPYCNPEIWGGIECTINRIGDAYSDQLASTGHYERHSDIHRLAGLGITALRYPILWERHQREKHGSIDWSWAAHQLDTIRSHDIIPIAGLLHHGSGPSFTQLDSDDFATGLAEYAYRVAERFPWIEYYTPVNEPLTTARFSGLYGIWYPHSHDASACMRMLMNQVKGTILAMRSIRSINPAAKLVQTEDLAKIHGSPEVGYQVEFENHRRWLTFDLLGGKVDKDHALWDYLTFIGIDERELDFFVQNPCVPDIMGLNYYVTSERYLDADIGKYPVERHGGNGTHSYVDVEAVRVMKPLGVSALLKEAWERYKWPMAVTEAHLNCTREEQLRWVKQIWDECSIARREGMDIRAVTVWALLGACDWDSLLTSGAGHYESGAFDVSETIPRMTALGHLIKRLATGAGYDHPLLRSAGWWQGGRASPISMDDELCIIGEEQECDVVVQLCLARGIPYRLLNYSGIEAMQWFIEEGDNCRPWGVIWISSNIDGRKKLASCCQDLNIPFLNLCLKNRTMGEVSGMLDLFVDKALEPLSRYQGERTLFYYKE